MSVSTGTGLALELGAPSPAIGLASISTSVTSQQQTAAALGVGYGPSKAADGRVGWASSRGPDFRPDLAKIDVPTHIIHGDDDQIVPFEVGGKRSAERSTKTGSTVTSSSAWPRKTKNQRHSHEQPTAKGLDT